MNIQLLLSEVSHISQKYELINQKTGGNFNIFDILNVSTDEVRVCRVIYELINTKGRHYQGYTYLKLFIENVLGMKFNDSEYKKANVHREYRISDGRRVDLVIEIDGKIIPIEVKIYAKDQQKQCYDYYKFAKNSNVFYLTLDRKCPSKDSAEGLTPIYDDAEEIIGYDEVTQISFENEIMLWLNECISHPETIKIAPIREIILQFMGVIRNMTNLLVEEKKDEIVNVISSSRENIKSAIEIEKSLETCKINIIKKVLEALEERLDNKFNEKDKVLNDYYKSLTTYYNKKGSTSSKSTCIGLSYFIKKLDKKNDDLLLKLGIDEENYLIVGFYTPEIELNEIEINDLLKKHEACSGGGWIYWEFLPYDNEAKCPKFKDFNEVYYDLFDEIKFNEFIDDCENSILKFLDKLK